MTTDTVKVVSGGKSLGALAPLATKAVQVLRQFGGLVEFTRALENSHQAAGQTVNAKTVLTLSAAWSCVNLLAGTMGVVPCMLYRRDRQGNREVDRDHPLFSILHEAPNTEQTSLEFWEFMQACLELRGSAYARKLMAAGRLVGLRPIPPDAVEPYRDKSGRIRYKVQAYDGYAKADLGTDLMFHIRGFGGDGLGGLSTISFGAKVFGQALAIEETNSRTFLNGLRPSGLLKFDKWLKPDQRDLAEKRLREDYAGATQAGRPMVLEGGVTWEALALKPDDVQMLESRAFSVEEVCRMFGVPPVLIGHANGTTVWGSGIEQIKQAFYTLALARRTRRIEQAIRQQLLTDQDRAQGYYAEFNMEGFLRGDSRGRTAYYNAGLSKGWLTVNEVRRMENRPPVPGGDVPRTQAQEVPLGTTQAPGAKSVSDAVLAVAAMGERLDRLERQGELN